MAFTNPETFGNLHIIESLGGREISKHAGVAIRTIAELQADPEEVRASYLKTLGLLSMHAAEIAHSRTIHGHIGRAQTVAAEHIFWTPKADYEATILYGIEGDNESHRQADGTMVTYDRKSSDQQMHGADGQVALQYDNLAWPPALRVVDLRGESQTVPGTLASLLPAGLESSIKQAVQG